LAKNDGGKGNGNGNGKGIRNRKTGPFPTVPLHFPFPAVSVAHFPFPISLFPLLNSRTASLAHLAEKTFDALIIGGGITGAGIARDAAMRGLSVAIIDKSDFASGTSSRSSRLIHGGVRYLEHGHLKLVFEASAERRRLLRLAPHLVKPLAFTWPIFDGQRLPLWKINAGLTLYDALAMFRNVQRHQKLNAEDVMSQEPTLRMRLLSGGVRYFDAATDDARLTLANVVDAAARGAVAANHLVFDGIERDPGTLRVAKVWDALSGDRFTVRAKVLVNATGPWSDNVRQMEGGRGGSRVQGSKGAHIAVDRDRVGNRDAIVMLHPRDGRVLFALPSGTQAIIGTTDTFTSASPEEVRASSADVDYLLEAANWYFPDAKLRGDDVIAAWAGIRPLMPTSGGEGSASREHAIKRSRRGTVTITGGKLTTYRIMARQTVDAVQELLGARPNRAPTGDTPLPPPKDAPRHSDAIPGLPLRWSELRRAIDQEFACTLGDLLIRRTKHAFESRGNARGMARQLLEVVSPLFGWDEARQAKEIERYEAEVTRIFRIDP
jgi:glycerol-3-phosphate dehydrogenase